MQTHVALNGTSDPAANYVGWAPVPCRVGLTESDGVADPVAVRLRNLDPSQGGQLLFFAAVPGAGQSELELGLPPDGSPVEFWVAGRFGSPSTADLDAAIETIRAGDGAVLSVTRLMVRIRKNANNLSTSERNRFISALAMLNNAGTGRFSDFRNVHTSAGDREAHKDAGFLPWHRAFLLDLERELQRIDPSVALPYWRFDQPAARVFARSFMGVRGSGDRVQFDAGNPLQFWATDQTVGITRRPLFDTTTSAARNSSGTVRSEASTLQLGGGNREFRLFRTMESQPHARAHQCFGGMLPNLHMAARDPLFFLLHSNVDRLWAKWQWFFDRFDTTRTSTFPNQGSSARVGHNLNDTMWPWNQVTGSPRPSTAPGGSFPSSPAAGAPGSNPAIRHMIDYQGVRSRSARLGFDYDDVPFEF